MSNEGTEIPAGTDPWETISGHVQPVQPRLSQETLRDMQTWDDAFRTLTEAGLVPTDGADLLGDGFEILKDESRDQLIGLPFMILSAMELAGDYGKSFVSLRIMTKDNRKLIINDGSTGIRNQIVQVLNDGGNPAGKVFMHGLRKSDYLFCPQCNHVSKTGTANCPNCGHTPLNPATTYYIDTSK